MGPNPARQPTCYGLRPSHAAELNRSGPAQEPGQQIEQLANLLSSVGSKSTEPRRRMLLNLRTTLWRALEPSLQASCGAAGTYQP